MAGATHFFLGANSGAGFQNLFPQLMQEDLYDLMILKGGPGVGKSTFMKQVGRTMEEAGLVVEYLWCSGDPDSLDGVWIPELRCALADGTAPHVLEPRYPAAVERYVDLGRFYDVAAAKAAREEILAQTKAYQAAYVRAYHCLQAARQVELEQVEAAAAGLDRERWERRARGLAARNFHAVKGNGAEGHTRRRFLGSVTRRGAIWRFDSVQALCPRVVAVADRWEQGGPLFALLHQTAQTRGLDTIACMAPEQPDRIEHLLIPELGLAFVTEKPGMEFPEKPWRRVRLDAFVHIRDRGRVRLSARMTDLLREEGIRALQEAGAAHDALEAVYNPYVDFDGVRALAALEGGRLLSYR